MLRPIYVLAFLFALVVAPPCVSGETSIQGNWVWTSAAANERNAYSYFRRSFDLEAVPKSAVARVAADSRYVLYVNGRRVGRGSARSHTAWTPYDTWDIGPYLKAGANVVAAVVHHYGEWTMQSQAGKAGFLCDVSAEGAAGTLSIRTGDDWKALPSAAWDNRTERRNRALGFVEAFDARQEPAGWTEAEFDDSAWPKAVVLGAAGCAPWTHLVPTDVPSARETVVLPKAVVSVLAVEPPEDAARIPFADLYADRPAWAVGYAATYLHASRTMAVTLQTGSDDALKVWLNGETVLLQPRERSGAPGQDIVQAHLRSGWNRLLVKSVKRTGPWQFFLALAGPNANSVSISSEKDITQADTWRVSPVYPFDAAKGLEPGYSTVYPPERAANEDGWRLLTSPRAPLNTPSTVVRQETRTQADPPLVTDAQTLLSVKASAQIQSDRLRDAAVVLDMGREVSGYPRITVAGARGGEVVDVTYAETLEGPDGRPVSPGARGVLNPDRGATRYGDRFICRPGDNMFETFEKKGFRYIQIDVRRSPRPITLTGVCLVLSTYPVEERGAFSCSDERLNRIWETARWTLLLNMDDAYTDCPWRERTQWFGDVRVEALSNYYAFGDAKLMRRALVQAAQSQDAEGVVRGTFPTDWDGARLPSYGLMWVFALWEYYVYTGDASLLGEMLPVMERQFAFFEKHRAANSGLLEDVPYWVFIDWADEMDGQRIGASGSLNALYYRALTAAVDIAKASGSPDAAATYAERAKALKAAFNKAFWSAENGFYWDVLKDGKPNGRTGQQVAALAVALGVAPRERWNKALDQALVAPGAVKIGTPYFGSFWLDALRAAGRDQEALDYIRTNWGRMLDAGATTFWEYWEPKDSLCHGWSTGPLKDLSARALGVRPTKPCWREFDFAPAFCDLKWAKGTVPTPLGDVRAEWSRSVSGTAMKITVPKGAVARVRAPGKAWTMEGGKALPAGVTVEADGALRLSAAGEYSLLRR